LIVAVNLIGLALAFLGIVRSGERTTVLVYAFILEFLLRLVTIQVMQRALQANTLESVIAAMTMPPAPRQRSYAPYHEDTRRPIPFHTYIIVVLLLAWMAFVIVNVGVDQQLHLDPDMLVRDLRWAFALAGIYWLEGLIGRTITIDRDAPSELNLGYNARDLVILAFAVLTAGWGVLARRIWRLDSSGWVVLAPLLVVRFFFDVSSARSAAKRARP
jgi:hypothetical protein